jgi:pimeloyl-ACP methyl ester carboxylesterase
VFESGYGALMSNWEPIFGSLRKVTRVFAYDRPGYGSSTQEQAPTTARQLAEQLHENLVSTGHPPPYVLVGHSAGGLYVNVFARVFPEDVAGVVLIDSSHPMQFEYMRQEQPDRYTDFLEFIADGEPAYEGSILKSIHTEFASIEPFPDVPLLVLAPETVASDEYLEQSSEYQKDLANMSMSVTHRVVEGSGHWIHTDQPQIVIEEIKGLLDTIQESE